MVYFARRLSGSAWTGLFAGLIMALTPTISFYAQTAREYATIIAVVLCATLALVRALEAEAGLPDGRITRRWVVYTLLIAVGGYLNEITLAVLAAHAVTVLLARPGRRPLRALGGIRRCGRGPGPARHRAQHPPGLGRLLDHPPDVPRPRDLFHDYFASNSVVAAALLIFAVIALLPAGGSEPPWWRRGGISLPSVAAPLLVMPAGVVLLESVVAHPVYVDRYVLYGETGAAMLAGAGVYRIGQLAGRCGPVQRALVAVTGAVVCAAVLLLQLGPQHRARTPESRLFDYGDPAFYIGAHARPGDGVMFFNWFFRKARLGYPEEFRDTTDFALAISPQQSGTLNGFDKPLDVVRRLMLGYRRIWVVGRAPSDHVASVAIRSEGELLMRRYKLIAERHYKSITVTLWQQR